MNKFEIEFAVKMSESVPKKWIATYIMDAAEEYLKNPSPENWNRLDFGAMLIGMREAAKANGGAEKFAQTLDQHIRISETLNGKIN